MAAHCSACQVCSSGSSANSVLLLQQWRQELRGDMGAPAARWALGSSSAICMHVNISCVWPTISSLVSQGCIPCVSPQLTSL